MTPQGPLIVKPGSPPAEPHAARTTEMTSMGSGQNPPTTSTGSGTNPPADLDAYVDWAGEKGTPDHSTLKLGRYHYKVLSTLAAGWFITAWVTYFFGFLTVEPGPGMSAGRKLVSYGPNNNRVECTPPEKELYGSQCPELQEANCVNGSREEWTYRDEQNSATAEFDLAACSDLAWVVRTIGSAFWIAYGLGVTTGGMASDRFGRKCAWYSFLSLMLLGSIILATAPNLWIFAAGRMIQAVGVGGFGVICFVWGAESMTTGNMHLMTSIANAWFVAGGCMPSLLTLLDISWRTAAWIAALACIPNYLVPMLMYESPKWLASNRDKLALHDVMSGIAVVNGRGELPPPSEEGQMTGKESIILVAEEGVAEDWRTMFHWLVIRRMIVSCALWFCLSYSYYSLNLFQPPKLFSNEVQDWCFGFFLELPAGFAAASALDMPLFGRRRVVAGGLVVAGVVLQFASLGYYSNVLYYVARMFIAGAFASVYTWSTELYPNSIRNSAVGINSFFARLGASLAPWVGDLEPFSLRMTLFAVPAIVIGLLALFRLPETRGKALPGYVEDLA